MRKDIPCIEARKIGNAVVSVSAAPSVVATSATSRPGIAPVPVRAATAVGVVLLVPQMWRDIAVARAATLQVQTSKLQKNIKCYVITVQLEG